MPPTPPCPVCGAVFDRPAKLVRHELSHSGSRPWICTVVGGDGGGIGAPCGKSFMRRDHLERHVVAEHTLERRFVCGTPGCGKAFYEPSHLQRHEKTHARPPREPAAAAAAAKPADKRGQQAAGAWGGGAAAVAVEKGNVAVVAGGRGPRGRGRSRYTAARASSSAAAALVEEPPQLSPSEDGDDEEEGGDDEAEGGEDEEDEDGDDDEEERVDGDGGEAAEGDDEGVGWAALGEAVAAVSAAKGTGCSTEEGTGAAAAAAAASAASAPPAYAAPPAVGSASSSTAPQPGLLRHLAAGAALRRRAAAPSSLPWDPADPVEGPSAIVDRLSPAAVAAAHPGLRDALAYACPFAGCVARLPGRTLWRAHIKTSHRALDGGGSFRCEACGQVERAVRGLERHWLTCGGGGGGGGGEETGAGADVAEAAAGGAGAGGGAANGAGPPPLKRTRREAPGRVAAAAVAGAGGDGVHVAPVPASSPSLTAAAATDVPMSAFLSSALALGDNPFYAPPALLWLDDGEGDDDDYDSFGGEAARVEGASRGGQQLPRSRAASFHSAPSPVAATSEPDLLLALPVGLDAGTSAAAMGTARRAAARPGKRGRGASMSSFDPLELLNA